MITFNVEWQGHAIAAAAGAIYNPAADAVIARVEHESLLAGVLFQSFTGASFTLHVAAFAPRWMNRDLLWVVFHYGFVQMGCTKLVTMTPSYNLKSLALNEHLGFKQEAVIKDVFPGGDAIVMGMRREACKWLSITPRTIREGNPSNGRQGTSPSGT